MASMLAVPETISSSQARPRAMDLISAVRRSAFIGRARDLALEAGSRISLNRLAGGFVHGINSAEFPSIGAGGTVDDGAEAVHARPRRSKHLRTGRGAGAGRQRRHVRRLL